MRQISEETNPDQFYELLEAHSVSAVPTFVIIDEAGESRTQSGWSESSIRDDLAWVTAS